jgi:hypothetical protein
MRHHTAFREHREWSPPHRPWKSFSLWSGSFRRRRAPEPPEAPAPSGTEPCERTAPPPKSLRDQYSISAILYGLVVLVAGLYFSATDVGRLASERGYALDPLFRTARTVPLRALTDELAGPRPAAVPRPQTYPNSPSRADGDSRPAASPRDVRPNRSRTLGTELPDSVRMPASPLPHRYLEDLGAARYGTAHHGA